MREPSWLIVPCYDEEHRLDQIAFGRFMREATSPSVLFVDDGSRDGTLCLLRELAAGAPDRCRVLALPRNAGKAEAVRAGLNAAIDAGASRVAYWDADLATPLTAFHDLSAELDRCAHAEVIMAARVRMLGRMIERSEVRHYAGRVYATLASLVLRLPVYDTQCGAKLFRVTPALRRALATPFRSGWSFDVELLRRLQLCWRTVGADRIVELPLREWRDVGQSKVSLHAGLSAFVSLLRLARMAEPADLPQLATPEAPTPAAVAWRA